MILEISDKELDAVCNLPSHKRYAYFVKKVVDYEELWSLWGKDGWVLAAGIDEGIEYLPVWPAKRYAQECASGEWDGLEAKSIDIDSWIARWIPGMIKDNRLVTVFPIAGNKGMSVSLEQLLNDLSEELELYE